MMMIFLMMVRDDVTSDTTCLQLKRPAAAATAAVATCG